MKVFLSYRRSDSEGWIDKIEKALRSRLAGVEIFRDVASIDSGERWLETIQQAIADSDIMLIVIGPTWLDIEKDGVRRLDDPDDIVRREVASGLEQRIDLIPVLVDGAPFPDPDALPADIQNLAWIHGHAVKRDSAERDLTSLIQRIGSMLKVRVQEQATSQGRASATGLLGRIEELIERDPKARDFEAYWQWFHEAKEVLLAASTGTEVANEMRRLEELLIDARKEDDLGRELAVVEAQYTVKHIRELFSSEEERRSDEMEDGSTTGGVRLLPGVSSFDPIGSWRLELSDSGGSGTTDFNMQEKGLVTGEWPFGGESRRMDGRWRLQVWEPPDEEGERWMGEKPMRVVGVSLDIKVEGTPSFELDIPIDEEYGNGYRGRDQQGRTFFLRKIS